MTFNSVDEKAIGAIRLLAVSVEGYRTRKLRVYALQF